MAYELGGKKKRPWWDLLLESFGGGVGLGGGTAPGAQATLLGESPVAAPAAKTPGLFTAGGITYGEESMSKPRAEWMALDPEEIARRRKAFRPERSRYAAKRREKILGELS